MLKSILVAVLFLLAVFAMACGDSGGGADISETGYLSITQNRVLFVRMEKKGDQLSGTMYHSTPARADPTTIVPQQATFTAERAEDALVLTVEGGHGFPEQMNASLDDDELIIYVPSDAGIVVPITLKPGTFDEYTEGVRAMGDRQAGTPAPTSAGTPSPEAP